MKIRFVFLLACFALVCVCPAKVVTLTVNSQPGTGPVVLSDEVSVGTNEVATITSIFGFGDSSQVSFVKGGITNSVTAPPSGASSPLPLTVAGPAVILLTTTFGGFSPSRTWFCTVKIEPESFPPGQTIILPEGTVGTIHVESSTNLIQWQDEWTQTFSNTNQNRFFRLRAERSLP